MRYKAFISYSHAADGKLAPAIQRALHRIAKPWYRLRTMRVFRDQTNLATSPGLWTSIESALRDAEFFVYLASPTAAQSPWVQKEVSWWLTNRSYQSFLIVLTDGEIAWDNTNQDLDWTKTTAIPRQTSKAFSEEPLYTDLRWARTVDQLSLRHAQFRTVLLDVAATLLNRAKDELDGDDVRQYRRTRRIASFGIVTLLALFVMAALAAYFATQQSLLATSRALSAQSEAVLATDPELALLLAREALKYKANDESEFALRQAFVRNPVRMIHHSATGRTIVARFVGSSAVVAAERGKPASVWDVATGKRVADLSGTVRDDLMLGESADHSVVAIPVEAEEGLPFILYDTTTWKPLPPLAGTDAHISRDGTVLTAVQGDKIRQWTLPSLKERDVKAALPEGRVVRDVSMDGSLLLLTENSDSSSGLIVRALSGQTVTTIPRSVFRTGEAFSPDGRLVVTERLAQPGGFDLWDTQSGRLVRSLEEAHALGWTTYVAFSPDSRMFVVGNRDGLFQGWNVETSETIRMLSLQRSDIFWIRFSPDGASMLSVAADGTACLWDTETMRCIEMFGGRGDDAFDVAFASDSRHFLTTHNDGSVRVWDRQVWQPTQTLPAKKAVVSDDNSLVLGLTESRAVTISNANGGELKVTLGSTPPEIECMALSPSKTQVAIAPTEGAVGIWNAETGAPTMRLPASSAETTAIGFDSTGTQLATGSKDGRVRFWSSSDGKLLGEWPGSEDEVHGLTFHPDGERIVVTSGRSTRVRERKSGAVLLEIQLDEEAEVEGVALNADGSRLLVTGDFFPQLWDLTSYKRVQTLEGHSDNVYSAAFSRDGRWLLTGSGYKRSRGTPPDDSNSVFVWDAKTGRHLLSYRSATWAVERISFANDGTTIFACGGDGTVRRYECEACVPLPLLIDRVASRTSRDLSADERARYIADRTWLGWLLSRIAR
jgi:WD40 repeat protein